MKSFPYSYLLSILLFSFCKMNAQSSIIGNPIKIENIEVAEYDFPDRMKLTDATTACNNLGFGWRLPTLDELGLIYKNINLVKNLKDPQLYYWSSNEVEGYRKNWFIRMSDGATFNISNYFTLGVRAVKTIKKDSEKYQIHFVGIGNIDVLTKDLEVMNYYQAKQAIEALGDGWRLPTENELQLMYNNQDKIGGLIRNRTYVGNQQVSSYLGGGFDKYHFELYTDANLAVEGKIFERNWNDESKNKFYYYIRPVRNRTVFDNKNTTSNKKKTTKNNNDDALSTILSLYQKQVLSDARSINKSSGNLDFGGKKSSNTQSQSNSGSDVCQRCKPSNNKGWYISDFNPSNRTYENFRYVLRPGYKMCTNCKGTGDCRVNCFRGKSDCPGVCSDNGTCLVCKGDRFIICRDCNGSGRKN